MGRLPYRMGLAQIGRGERVTANPVQPCAQRTAFTSGSLNATCIHAPSIQGYQMAMSVHVGVPKSDRYALAFMIPSSNHWPKLSKKPGSESPHPISSWHPSHQILQLFATGLRHLAPSTYPTTLLHRLETSSSLVVSLSTKECHACFFNHRTND